MAGYKGFNGPNPMQRHDCPFCGQQNVAGTKCPNCNRKSKLPFVAIFDVGQGNCNAIVGAGGRVLAYFDYGYSTTGTRQPTPKFKPCFCDKPIIVLSHWDLDHINLARHPQGKEGLTMNWLVPDQDHSDFATKVQRWIKQAGGRLMVWPQTGPAQRHAVFPWGFVEHCTEDPNHGINGSGLAAFVCVKNSRTHPAFTAKPAAPPADMVATAADVIPLPRARAAAAAIDARVDALIALAHRPAVKKIARPLAAMLAASQTIQGRQPHMPVAECNTAAVQAADRVRQGLNAGLANHLNNTLGILPTLRGHNAGWANTVGQELAAAAIAVAPANIPFNRKVQIASTHFTKDAKIDADSWARLGIGAFRPAPVPPGVQQGLAPLHSGECFVLLNGDADFRWVPSMNRRRRPRVVALTAMHHGAVFEDGYALARRAIPFGPGSRQAKAVLRFRRARTVAPGDSVVSVAAEAGRALSRKKYKARRRVLRQAASRTACAAAAAIHAVQLAHPGEVTAAPRKFAAAAAAAAVAAWKYDDARIVGLATLLGSTTERVAKDTDCSPIETVVEVAARAIRAEVAQPALTADQVAEISAGALDGGLMGHVPNIANDSVANGQAALTPDNAGTEAASDLVFLFNSYRHGLSAKKAKDFKNRIALDAHDEDVLNDLATAATAAILASRRGKRHHRSHSLRNYTDAAGNAVAVAGGSLGNLFNRVVATTSSSYGAAPALLVDEIALNAARFAAERAVAYEMGTTAEAIRTVAASARSPRRKSDAFRALSRRETRDGLGGRIAYSYGVDEGASKKHEYPAPVAGGLGHPHPLAVMAYEAHGWTRRRNASRRANHQGLQGDTDRSHPAGPAALGWNSLANKPYAPGKFTVKCASCGRPIEVRD